ncbi:MAG: DUF2330 domain-containing protein [Deltaproteobacteria bacterium]|nr:DUF2330 domain-containing protein [Deltaproteobacteria bacterium]MBT6434889.1 DUF2330 domain-containing protein [Deltaproteobacteria bacterium]MBT6489033.1 DUF2330 domain-containing protein [Deltaproteobacteria bacterium]
MACGAFGYAPAAQAFCGFYVAGGESSLFNDATQAVLMRAGQRTVLSMQNNYQGPPENFAMVVPVPTVLQQENVRTLSAELFAKIDTLSAPRLVEYWEMDPCETRYYDDDMDAMPESGAVDDASDGGEVTVEAEFAVGEYDIVILSTNDSTALAGWLTDNEYSIPEGAGPYLEPYVQNGMYFFVARVNAEEVTMNEGNAVLSPLRFYYDSNEFSLPVRLGLINSQGDQDLIVYTLGLGQRYEVANRTNVTIPTNIEVVDEVRNDFGSFYRTLFDETVALNPGAAVTEYSWDASTCDPCPGPTLDRDDFATLGADVIDADPWANWTLTRMHLRYSSDTLGDDLVFSEAEPIVGGRERYNDQTLEVGSTPASYNNFQGRYIIRHAWTEPVTCEEPVYGRWGGPGGAENPGQPQGATSPNTEGDASSADEGSGDTTLPSDDIADLVAQDIPEINVEASGRFVGEDGAGDNDDGGCGCQSTDPVSLGLLVLFGLWVTLRRRKPSQV